MPIKNKKARKKEERKKEEKIIPAIIKKSGFLKEYLKKQGEKIRANKRKQFAFFVLGFILAYLVLTFAVSLVPETAIKQAVGETVRGALSLQGINTTEEGIIFCQENSWIGDTVKGECYSFFIVQNGKVLTEELEQALEQAPHPEGKAIVISWLCTGVLEIIILVSAIIASFGVSWRKKIIGVIAAAILGALFNLLRIWVTINLILTQNTQTVELAHDMLFRFILFIYIFAVYVIWFYWAAKEK